MDGIVFHSAAEANRYTELKWQEQTGYISDLQRQVPFVLGKSITSNRDLRLVMDFTYTDTQTGERIAEDKKGYFLPEAKVKLAWWNQLYGTVYKLRIT